MLVSRVLYLRMFYKQYSEDNCHEYITDVQLHFSAAEEEKDFDKNLLKVKHILYQLFQVYFLTKLDLTLFTMRFFGSKTKNVLSMKLSSQKHVSFVSIVCLFSYLVCVTRCDYSVISITTSYKLCKIDT